MRILHRYLLTLLLKNLGLCLLLFTLLFLMIDFFDRIDNIMAAGGTFGATFQYFLYKLPLTINLMLPISVLVATLFTFGILSKNSEVVAMRAAGLSVFWLARPALLVGLAASLLAMALNETVVPVATRRVKEIYNIDIQKKDETGSYSHNDFWWRKDNRFITVRTFDSRTNTMHDVTVLDIGKDHQIKRRIDASEARWIDPILGWTMKGVTEQRFPREGPPVVTKLPALPLPLTEEPEEFYDVKTEPDTMSYRALKRYMRNQAAAGVPVSRFFVDLYEKISFPFVSLVVCVIALPFSLRSARSGGLAASFMAGLLIGFSYYVVHSLCVAMGRAEFLNPLLAAWIANFLMGFVGAVLLLGAESPQ